MKNFPKNNSKRNKTNKNNNVFDNKNKTKSANFSEDNNSQQNKNNSRRKPIHNKRTEFSKYRFNDKKGNDFTLSTRNSSNKFNAESSNNYDSSHKNPLNKKNLDDWVWGKHSVYEALSSDRAINRIWCTSEIFSSEKFYILLKNLKSKGVLIEEVSWNRLSQMTFGATHQGVAMQFAYSKSIDLNKLIDLSKVNSKNPILLALDGIKDPHNLGAIIRSAEAFGCKGIIIPQRRSAGLTGTVAKVAAGALEHIHVSRVVNLNRALDELKKNGFFIVGLSEQGKLPISKFNETSPLVVIVGAEDRGISLLAQKKCNFLLRIPLKGKTASLNASVAAAISLFHLSKN